MARFLLPALLVLTAGAQDTHLIMLGTGTPNPDPNRVGPTTAVVIGGRAYFVDCGPGVVRRAAQAGIPVDQQLRVFITHLHSDHTAGYPDLILTPPNTGREKPLQAWGPPGLKAMTDHILKAWREDFQIRLHDLQPGVAAGFSVIAHDVKPGEIYRDENVRVIAFPVNHGHWKYAYGYRFEAKDKTIVFSGDTTFSKSLITAAKGCDILVHEVYSQEGLKKRTPDWQKYHSTYHTSGPDLGRIAAEVRPKKLVIYHSILWGEPEAELIGEIRQNWNGEVIFPKDLDVIR